MPYHHELAWKFAALEQRMNTKHAEYKTGLERIAGENKATLERLRADMANQKVWLWLFVLVFGAVVTGVTLGIALSG